MENIVEGFKSRFKQAAKIISELEDTMMAITESEKQKEKRLKKSEQSPQDLWDTIKWTVCIVGIQDENVPEISCTTMRLYLTITKCTFRNV